MDGHEPTGPRSQCPAGHPCFHTLRASVSPPRHVGFHQLVCYHIHPLSFPETHGREEQQRKTPSLWSDRTVSSL